MPVICQAKSYHWTSMSITNQSRRYFWTSASRSFVRKSIYGTWLTSFLKELLIYGLSVSSSLEWLFTHMVCQSINGWKNSLCMDRQSVWIWKGSLLYDLQASLSLEHLWKNAYAELVSEETGKECVILELRSKQALLGPDNFTFFDIIIILFSHFWEICDFSMLNTRWILQGMGAATFRRTPTVFDVACGRQRR